MVKVGRYDYKKSTNPKKKLMTVVDGKTIHFGNRIAPSNQHFKDKTRIWKSLDHGDSKRRASFLARSKGIKKKDGSLAWKNPSSPAYHAVRILW